MKKKIIGINFLHTHPNSERRFGLDSNHIIVDRKDWEEVVETLQKDRGLLAPKTFGNTTASQAKDNVSDIQFWGDGNTWKLISKAWSKKEGWMKSTKAMEITGAGCLVQVTTQQGDNISEAVTFVPNASIYTNLNDDGYVISRFLMLMKGL